VDCKDVGLRRLFMMQLKDEILIECSNYLQVAGLMRSSFVPRGLHGRGVKTTFYVWHSYNLKNSEIAKC
jgi:hypothetical protein